MTHGSLLNADWQATVERLGGAAALEEGARKTGAFVRARVFGNAIDMLRMILAYCLGGGGLRSTAAWAASIGLVDVANTALLYRLRQSEKWLACLVGQALGSAAPKASQGRVVHFRWHFNLVIPEGRPSRPIRDRYRHQRLVSVTISRINAMRFPG